MPEELRTEQGQEMMRKLMEGDFVDEDFYPRHLSIAERSIVVTWLSERLNIDHKWQVFGEFWQMNPNTLRTSYSKAMGQRKTLDFQDRLKRTMG